ncbi:hypothetical protein AB0L83_34770 [Streptomyces sp. NPDC052071]|uniref:hypothetical protein n=1 Tax=Streptomyces sp. NPDC052071 TaxID=3156666 RepID=UPI003426FCA4
MVVHDFLVVLAVVTALRVFAPDARALTRRLLSAGVRVGTTQLLEDTSAAGTRLGRPPLPDSHSGEA